MIIILLVVWLYSVLKRGLVIDFHSNALLGWNGLVWDNRSLAVLKFSNWFECMSVISPHMRVRQW